MSNSPARGHASRPIGSPVFKSAIGSRQSAITFLLLAVLLAQPGCARGPGIIATELRKPIDRNLVEFPANFELERFVTNLTAPTAMAFDPDRNALLVAESGAGGREPRILGFDLADDSTFTVYPQGKQFLGLRTIPFRMYGPVGGLAVRDGTIYVSHRDDDGFGVISALTYEGNGATVVGGLPAQGDYGVTDLVIGPAPDRRLYFGVGAATNSGVVGLDNWAVGWPRRHPQLADRPYRQIRLRGSKFFTNNPWAGLFTGSELAITAPFQPFTVYYKTRIDAAPGGKPNAAIYSVAPTGGIARDLRVEAHGVRHPGGLAFNNYDRLYASNQGMQLRGSRPVRDDPDTVLEVRRNKWYGWPDFSADLLPITDEQFQPLNIPGMADYLRKTGNTELTFVLEHTDDLSSPEPDRDALVRAAFAAQSGAAKMTFLPSENTPFEEFADELVVALSGDRAPFATMGKKLKGAPIGGKVVRFDADPGSNKVVHDFIRNTAGLPRSKSPGDEPDLLERPIDVKIGPDGYLYVLDFGRLEMRGGKERITPRTGQVFRLRPAADATTTAPSESTESTELVEPTEPAEPEPAGDDAPAE